MVQYITCWSVSETETALAAAAAFAAWPCSTTVQHAVHAHCMITNLSYRSTGNYTYSHLDHVPHMHQIKLSTVFYLTIKLTQSPKCYLPFCAQGNFCSHLVLIIYNIIMIMYLEQLP